MKNFKLWQGDLKRIFKKLLPIALSVTMAFSFVGCGKEKDKNGVVDNTNPPYTTPIDPTPSNPNNQTPADPTPSTPSTPTTPDKDKDEPSTPTTPDKDKDKDEPTTPTDPDDNPTTPTDPDDKKDPDDQDPDTPPVVEEFSLAENKDKIIENVMPLVNYYKRKKYGNSATIDKVYDIYITAGENSQTIDTIGAVFSGKTPAQDIYFEYGTITLPTSENIEYKNLSKSQQTNTSDLILTRKYNFIMTASSSIKFAETIKTIQQKLFDNYDNALWLGWSGTTTPQYDYHQIVNFDGSSLRLISIDIKNDGNALTFPSGPVEKYFINDEYTLVADKVEFTLPNNTLSAQVQKELQEKQQQI